MVLDLLATSNKAENARIEELLKIVHNSTNHLWNVIEDALDVTRLANHKFEINKERFNLRKSVQDVFDIMKFQIEQKSLQFKLEFSDSIP